MTVEIEQHIVLLLKTKPSSSSSTKLMLYDVFGYPTVRFGWVCSEWSLC